MSLAASMSLRPTDRREIDARVGMAFFLGSWAMVFLTLFFSAAVLRLRSEIWPPLGSRPLPLAIPAVNTALLALSSLAVHRGVRAVDRGAAREAALPLGAALLCGTAFLGLQVQSWVGLWGSGVRMQDGTYESLFWALTTFHGLHVLAGLAALVALLPVARRAWSDPAANDAPVRDRIRVHASAMFWHFVDVAWLATFLVIYVV